FCTAARLTSAGFCSRFGKSGEGTSVVATDRLVFGRSFVSVCSLISRRGHGSQVHYVGHVRQNFRRIERSRRIDQSLPRMRWMRRIRENSLARMEGVGAFGRRRIGRTFGARRGFLFARHVEKRQIVDRSGPRQLRIVERRVAFCRSRKLRPGNQQKRHLEGGGRQNSAAGESAINPAIAKKIGQRNSTAQRGTLE